MNILKIFLIFVTSAGIIIPLISTAADDIYHSKTDGPMSCNDRKITIEINFAADHPGTLDDDHFFNLATRGNCAPLSSKVDLELIRFETLMTPTGLKKLAYLRLLKPSSVPDYFYMMQTDIVKIATLQIKPKAP